MTIDRDAVDPGVAAILDAIGHKAGVSRSPFEPIPDFGNDPVDRFLMANDPSKHLDLEYLLDTLSRL